MARRRNSERMPRGMVAEATFIREEDIEIRPSPKHAGMVHVTIRSAHRKAKLIRRFPEKGEPVSNGDILRRLTEE